jgi:lipoate-protein ligase A
MLANRGSMCSPNPNPSPGSCWRLIPPIAADGLTQMAIDDWMIDRVRQGYPPILRFYTWSKPTLSLGFHQKQRPTVPDSIPLVRRPTGGRAVLHGSLSDLTYAIAMRTAKTSITNISTTKTSSTIGTISKRTRRADVYCDICRFLIRGWSQLGVTLHFGHDRDYANRTSCFGTATAADLVTDDGAKLIGSAQLYRGDTVLQHGSMQLAPDRELFAQIFGEPCRAAVLPELTTEEIIATLTEAARSSFGATFETRELDAAEWQDIEARRDRFRATTLRTVTLG